MKIRLIALMIILGMVCVGCAHGTAPASRFEEIMASGRLGYISDAEELELFAASEYAPEGFVHPKSLTCIGKAKDELIIMDDPNSRNYTGYIYVLNDANETELTLTVQHNSDWFWNPSDYPEIPISESMDNMLNCKQDLDSWAYICENNVYYVYGDSGNLLWIKWYLNGIEFHLDFSGTNLMGSESTFLTRLLSESKFERTVAIKTFTICYWLFL